MYKIIAYGDFAVLRTSYPLSSSSSSNALVINQFPKKARTSKNQCEVAVPSNNACLNANELTKVHDKQPLSKEMLVKIDHDVIKKRELIKQHSAIHFYRSPFTLSWIEGLVALFSQLPSEKRDVSAKIGYQDILDRRKENKRKDQSNSQVMGENSAVAFKRFMQTQSIRFTDDQLEAISPQWCHAVMSAALTSSLAQSRLNLFCAPEGLNVAMRTPEMMVMALAEHLQSSEEKVHVNVSLQLLIGTSILKSMIYRIKTEAISISVNIDHPFQMPHFQFERQGAAYLQDIIDDAPKPEAKPATKLKG